MHNQLLHQLQTGDIKSLARCITIVENELDGFSAILESLPVNANAKVVGITGPPGAGKSTITDALIGEWVADGKKVAVLCVDPSSPFNLGAVLGDRIRMSDWYDHPNVYIRSLATRGAMGGLHPRIIEITDVVKAAGFDIVIVETVGVGQSEVDIAGLADCTVVVLVPESGDEVQTMKAGLMEIADIFVVNKADRPGADNFLKNLRLMLAPAFHNHSTEIPILATVAAQKTGIGLLKENISTHQLPSNRKQWLLAERAFQLIQSHRMKDVNKSDLAEMINREGANINLYRFVAAFEKQHKLT